MIEDNVINYIDLGESMQNLDVYSKKGLIFFFKIFEIMLSYKVNNQIIFILLKIIFFSPGNYNFINFCSSRI